MMDRRRFLTRMGTTAAVAMAGPTALAACSSSTQTSGPAGTNAAGAGTSTTKPDFGEPLLNLAGAQSPIKNVVVVMMENRSFDHWLGWLANDSTYLEAGKRAFGGDFTIDGNQKQSFPGPNGSVDTAHLLTMLKDGNPYRGCDHPDPGHSWKAGRAERDGGFLATGSGNDPFALGYYLGDDLPISSKLATRFTVCDQSFASVLGPTFPNREYLLSAQSGGNKTNALPTAEGFAWDNIFDRLLKANVTVKDYYTDLPVAGLWGPRMAPVLAKVDDYFTDAKAGTLPQVSFVDPGFSGGNRTDNHPHGDIRAGEKFVRDVFAAFASSPQWANGVFILTYDEWGGFFDHVKPPRLPDERASDVDDENFGHAGFRVPTVIASPFSKPGFVDHQQYDHTSILRFLEWRFLGAPATGTGGSADWSLTTRDRNANNIGASLVSKANPEIGFELNVKIPDASEDCAPAGSGTTTTPTTAGGTPNTFPSYETKHSMEELRDTGLYEAMGFDTEASSMVRDWVS